MTILVIDDSEIFRYFLSAALQDEGHQVHCAANTAEGVTAIESIQPQLVCIDLNLDDECGLALCRQLRARANLERTAIIIMSAEPTAEVAEVARDAGADGFVEKTGAVTHWRAAVTEAVRRRMSVR